MFTGLALLIAAPLLLNPTNGSSISSGPTIYWQSVSGSSQYRIIVDTDSTPVTPYTKDYYTTNTNYSPQLDLGTYFWKVKTKDSSDTWSEWSPIWTFILSSTPSPSPSPSISQISQTSQFNISNIPSKIDSTDTITTSINLSLPSNPNSKFYLKGAFKKTDGSNYFGLTQVESSWVKNGQSYSEQYPITTDGSGNWSGSVIIQVDPFDSGYDGNGDYTFKVGRYTAAGSGPTWSNEVTIHINAKEVLGSATISNLTIPSSSPTSRTSSNSQNIPDLPDSVYSLENYRRLSTDSGQPATKSPTIIQSDKRINFLPFIGGALLILSLAVIVYIYRQTKVKSE